MEIVTTTTSFTSAEMVTEVPVARAYPGLASTEKHVQRSAVALVAVIVFAVVLF